MTYQRENDETVDPRVREVVSLLSGALRIIDEFGYMRSIGARLHEVLESIRELELQSANDHVADEAEELAI